MESEEQQAYLQGIDPADPLLPPVSWKTVAMVFAPWAIILAVFAFILRGCA